LDVGVVLEIWCCCLNKWCCCCFLKVGAVLKIVLFYITRCKIMVVVSVWRIFGKLYVKILKCKKIILGLWFDDDVWLIIWWWSIIYMYVCMFVMVVYVFSRNRKTLAW